MQVNFNNAEITMLQTPEVNTSGTSNELNLSSAILNLQNLNISEPAKTGVTSFSSEAISEKRRILQRALNLQDAADSLLSHLKSNSSSLSGSLATDTSSESLAITFGEEENTINSVGSLSNLSSGSFSINGIAISINTEDDSLIDVLNRINTAEAGVQASYDYAEQTVTIKSLNQNQILLENGSSNFFSGLNLHEGYIAGDITNNEESVSLDSKTQLYFSRFATRFNRLLNSDFALAEENDFRDALIQTAQNSIRNFIDGSFSTGEVHLNSSIKMNINSELANFLNSTIEFDEEDNPNNFLNFLSSPNGLVSPFVSLTESNNNQLKESLSSKSNGGLIISTQI